MGLFDRFKKKTAVDNDYERLSVLGDDADAWDELGDDELKQVLLIKGIEYPEPPAGGAKEMGKGIPAISGQNQNGVSPTSSSISLARRSASD